MSLTRRLRRIVRAHLGSLREDPFDDDEEPVFDTEADPATGDASAEASASGVPPDVAEAYRALEVPVGSDRETVKKGYRRVMKQYHQDRFQDDEEKREIAGTVSKRLNNAYERVTEYLDNSSS
jgi:DnaJ-class molecular chaperone with C-terminal Zn finger domain